MKLQQIEPRENYRFLLKFENGEFFLADLENLIAEFVEKQELKTAEINQEWGCLEFKCGKVDIEPKTLYRYAKNNALSKPS